MEFEDYVLRTHQPKYTSEDSPHGNSEYIMKEFEKYERFFKKESLEIFRMNQIIKAEGQLDEESHEVNIDDCVSLPFIVLNFK